MRTGWLYLFSSNIRPLYEQDVIDLLAAPAGSIYRFRYELKYLGSDVPDGLAGIPGDASLPDLWEANQLVNVNVIALYSIQQPESYHRAAFIPIRSGTVRETGADGAIHWIDFEVGDYALCPGDVLKLLAELVLDVVAAARALVEGNEVDADLGEVRSH